MSHNNKVMKRAGTFWITLVGVALNLVGAATAFAQPGYGQPGYGRPGYGQPGYGRPDYDQPGYYNRPYDDPYGPNDGFYDDLAPYGQWVNTPEYGTVWIPDVDRGFQPYVSNGYWVMTEYGNTWVSNYAWGWAPFHYGRWFLDRYNRWAWVPGYEWAPAWVSWRSGGGYYGWAPLGPGLNINVNVNIPPSWWTFVPQMYITSPRLYSYCVPRPRVVNVYQSTTIINNVYRVNNRSYNYGPRREEIEYVTRRSVPVYRLEHGGRPGRDVIRQNSLGMYRPDMDRNRNWRADGNRNDNRREYSRGTYTPNPRDNRPEYNRPNYENRQYGPRGDTTPGGQNRNRYEPPVNNPVPDKIDRVESPQRAWERAQRPEPAPQPQTGEANPRRDDNRNRDNWRNSQPGGGGAPENRPRYDAPGYNRPDAGQPAPARPEYNRPESPRPEYNRPTPGNGQSEADRTATGEQPQRMGGFEQRNRGGEPTQPTPAEGAGNRGGSRGPR